jgi:CubicO group peptidase (beta-lactamase class C family)
MNLKGIRRFLFIIAVVALVQLLGGCPAPEQKAAKYESVKAELEKLIEEEMARGGITGLSIALVDDQDIVWAQGFGFADKDKKIEAGKDTVYRVGSISKLFTDMSVLKLQEEGKLSIDEDITKYVPEFHLERPFETDKPTTLRQLMAHCSGFLRESPVGSYFDDTEPSIQATVESIYGLPLVYPPETKMKYSNIGITLVGYAVQRVAGEPFEDYVRENLLRPIGMESSDYVLTDNLKEKLSTAYMWVAEGDTAEGRRIEAPVFKLGTVPAGNLYSTVEDLCRFHSFIFNTGKAGGKQIIEEKTLQQMMTRQFETEGAARNFGLGFVIGDVNGHETYGHGGAVYGFSSSFIGMPDQKIGVVVLANEDVANSITDKIAVRALVLMLAAKTGEKPPEQEKTIELEPAALAKFVGTYESLGYWAEVEERDGKLHINYSGQKADMQAVGDNEFSVIGRGFAGRIAFTVAEDGSVSGFKVGAMDFVRIDPNAVYDYPDAWDKLVGAYGPDFIPALVSVKYGHLYAFMENVFDYRLEQVSDTVYKFNYGLYEGENLEFFLAPDGTVERIVMAHVEFKPIK